MNQGNMKRKRNNISFVIGNEYQLNEPPHNAITPPDKQILSNVKLSKKLGLCNGFRIFTDFWGLKGKKIDELTEGGKYFVIIDLFRCRPKTIDMVMQKMKQYGESVWGCLFGERDNCCEWGEYPYNFKTKAEAAKWFKYWVLNKALVWKRPQKSKGLKKIFLEDLKTKFLKEGNFAEYLKNKKIEKHMNLVAHAGALFSLHHFYELGFRFVWLERNCYLTNVQMGVAFLRGAAKQYSGYWGLDFSPWGALFGTGLVHYDKKGRQKGGGAHGSLYLREWLVAFFSGTNFLFQEYSSYTHWLAPSDLALGKTLSPMGKNAKRFADFTLRKYPDRGKPYVPVALMLEHDHGWDPPRWERPNFVWGDKIPYGPAERMIEYFFDWAFPEYKMAGIGYEPGCNPSVPWKTREEYDSLFKRGYDVRPFDKGILSSSKWGDSFDVVLDNCPLKVLKNYKAVFLLGRVILSKSLLKILRLYVEDGGILLVNSNHLFGKERLYFNAEWDKSLTNFFGVRALEFSKELFGPVRCCLCKKEFAERRFVYTRYEPTSAEVIAESYNAIPLVFVNKVGAGKVILTAPHYLLGQREAGLLQTARHLFDHIMDELSIVRVRGGHIEYLVNKKQNGLMVSLLNHSSGLWNGEMSIRNCKRPLKIRELWNEKDVAFKVNKDAVVFQDSIAPFDFKIYEIGATDGN